MPVFKDFSENGELLQIRSEPLNEQNLSRYIKVNGFENAQGYLEGLQDIMNAVDDCLKYEWYNRKLNNSPAVTRTKTRKLQIEKLGFVKFGEKHIEYVSSNDTSKNPSSDFSENSELLQTSNEPLNTQNFGCYVAKNGIGRAQGYLDAARDMTNTISGILQYKLGKGMAPNTPSFVRAQMCKLYEERSAFLEFGKKFIQEPTSSSPSEAPKP